MADGELSQGNTEDQTQGLAPAKILPSLHYPLGGVALQEAQRKLLIWLRSTIWAGCYLDDLVPAKPAVWSSSASSITVCLSWHKVWSPNVQDWERRWGQLHKSLVEINILYARGASGVSAQNWASCSSSCIVLEAFFGEKGIRHYSLEGTDPMIRQFWEHLQTDPVCIAPGLSLYTAEQPGTLAGFIRIEKAWFFSSQISRAHNPMVFLRAGLKHTNRMRFQT